MGICRRLSGERHGGIPSGLICSELYRPEKCLFGGTDELRWNVDAEVLNLFYKKEKSAQNTLLVRNVKRTGVYSGRLEKRSSRKGKAFITLYGINFIRGGINLSDADSAVGNLKRKQRLYICMRAQQFMIFPYFCAGSAGCSLQRNTGH